MKIEKIISMGLLLVFLSVSAFSSQLNPGESISFTASDITHLTLTDIRDTDVIYHAVEGADSIKINFTVLSRDVNESQIEITSENSQLTIIMEKGRTRNPLRGRSEKSRNLMITIEGPDEMDISFSGSFSNFSTRLLKGDVNLNLSFSNAELHGIKGILTANASFSHLKFKEMEGTFRINSSFSETVLGIDKLTANSAVTNSFGELLIEFGEETGALVSTGGTFSETRIDGTRSSSDDNYIIGNGGHLITANSSFGKLTIRELPEIKGVVSQLGSSPGDDTVVYRFEGGKIISVRVRGNRHLSTGEVLGNISIRAGSTYSIEEIEKEVRALPQRNRLIHSATCTIDPDGNLVIRIREKELRRAERGLTATYSRVGGVGLGPELKIKNELGLVNLFEGRARYNFGSEEWTAEAMVRKNLFDLFPIGGSWRKDYISNMDWAIGRTESALNEFFFAREVQNFFKVEGVSGYVRFEPAENFHIQAEYFDESFSSLTRKSRWALFGSISEPNPQLASESEGGISGMRYSLYAESMPKFSSESFYFEFERASKVPDGYGTYDRYFAELKYIDRFTALRVAGGFSSSPLPDQRAFRLGGINTLRGWPTGSVTGHSPAVNGFLWQGGGSKMFLANLELYLLDEGLRFIVFGDAGNVWLHNENPSVKGLKSNIGIGIQLGGGRGFERDDDSHGLRFNWAVPLGEAEHKSVFTLNTRIVF